MDFQHEFLQCALRIERLVSGLASKQKHCRKCHRMLALAPTEELMDTEDETYNRLGAALFLRKSEKQVYRYRIAGDLPYFRDKKDNIRYRQSDLEKLFVKLWGFPPKSGKKKS